MVDWIKILFLVLADIWLVLELVNFFLPENASQVSELKIVGLIVVLLIAIFFASVSRYLQSSQANRRTVNRALKFLVVVFSLLLIVYFLAQFTIILAIASAAPVEVIVNRVAIYASVGGLVLGVFWLQFIWPKLKGRQLDE